MLPQNPVNFPPVDWDIKMSIDWSDEISLLSTLNFDFFCKKTFLNTFKHLFRSVEILRKIKIEFWD